FGPSVPRQPELGGAEDAAPLAGVDRFGRPPAAQPGARLDLDENQEVPLGRHQVDLARPGAEAALENAPALALEMSGRDRLSVAAETGRGPLRPAHWPPSSGVSSSRSAAGPGAGARPGR